MILHTFCCHDSRRRPFSTVGEISVTNTHTHIYIYIYVLYYFFTFVYTYIHIYIYISIIIYIHILTCPNHLGPRAVWQTVASKGCLCPNDLLHSSWKMRLLSSTVIIFCQHVQHCQLGWASAKLCR